MTKNSRVLCKRCDKRSRVPGMYICGSCNQHIYDTGLREPCKCLPENCSPGSHQANKD